MDKKNKKLKQVEEEYRPYILERLINFRLIFVDFFSNFSYSYL